jgi:hypothetical protein
VRARITASRIKPPHESHVPPYRCTALACRESRSLSMYENGEFSVAPSTIPHVHCAATAREAPAIRRRRSHARAANSATHRLWCRCSTPPHLGHATRRHGTRRWRRSTWRVDLASRCGQCSCTCARGLPCSCTCTAGIKIKSNQRPDGWHNQNLAQQQRSVHHFAPTRAHTRCDPMPQLAPCSASKRGPRAPERVR